MRCFMMVIVVGTISTQSTAQWKQIGPWTTPQIFSATVNNSTLFVGSGNGFYKIDDVQKKWTYLSGGIGVMHHLAVRDSFLSAWITQSYFRDWGEWTGLSISTDRGNSWTTVLDDSAFVQQELCTSVEINGSTLFVASILSDSSNMPNYSFGGLRISRDNGKTWTKTDNISLAGGIGKLYADGNTLYAAGKGLYKSTDIGSHWQLVGIKDSSLNFIAAKGSRILAGHVLRSWDKDSSSSLYFSSDGGASWKTIWHSDTIVLKSASLGENKIFILTNKGKVFSSIVDNISWMDNTGICAGETPIQVLTNGSLTYALFNNAAFVSPDNGISWSSVKEGYSGTGINVLAASGSNIYSYGNEFYRSTDNGKNWNIIPRQVYMYFGIYSLVANGSVAFAGSFDGLYKSTDNGNRWDYTGAYGNWGYSHREEFHSILMSGSEVYAGSFGQIFHSSSNGDYGTWTCSLLDSTKVPPYISPPGADIHSIVIKGSKIFVTYGGVMRSTDGGLKWKSVNTGLTNIPINHEIYQLVAIDSCLFAATDHGVFLSTNDGANWTLVINGLPKQSSGAGPEIRNFLALGSNLFVPYGTKIFLTTNFGSSWTAVDSGLTSGVNILVSDGINFFAGTSRGIWRRPVSEMIPTSVQQSSSQQLENYSLSQNYPNPFNPSTTITFSIPERSNVRLLIYNTLGQKISEIMNETKDVGSYEQSFNASPLSSGIYFYRIEATSVTNSKICVETKKMILLR